MARKAGRLNSRGLRTSLVRVSLGPEPESCKAEVVIYRKVKPSRGLHVRSAVYWPVLMLTLPTYMGITQIINVSLLRGALAMAPTAGIGALVGTVV